MSLFDFLSFFKKDDKYFSQNENEFLINLFTKLGPKYDNIINQLKDGIVKSKRYSKETPGYVSFKLDVDLLNKYEVKKGGRQYVIEGIKILNTNHNKWVELKVKIVYGLIMGYFCDVLFEFDLTKSQIDIQNYYIRYIGEEEFKKISHFFSKEQLNYINPSDIYSINISGILYYHICETEDGNFIGMDENKLIYKVSHDPFKVQLLDTPLLDILKT